MERAGEGRRGRAAGIFLKVGKFSGLMQFIMKFIDGCLLITRETFVKSLLINGVLT